MQGRLGQAPTVFRNLSKQTIVPPRIVTSLFCNAVIRCVGTGNFPALKAISRIQFDFQFKRFHVIAIVHLPFSIQLIVNLAAYDGVYQKKNH